MNKMHYKKRVLMITITNKVEKNYVRTGYIHISNQI